MSRRSELVDSNILKLQERKVLLEDRLTKIMKDASAPHSQDFAEQAQERENDEVLDSIGNSSLDQLFSVRKALQRYADGEYGICSNCGAKISKERLEALPDTELCIECARTIEEF